jgi:hypothetical protein
MHIHTKQNTSTHLSVLLLSVCLIFSFGMHAIQITHGHVHFDNDHAQSETPQLQISEYMHYADKKHFNVMLLSTLLLFFYVSTRQTLLQFHSHAAAQLFRTISSTDTVGRGASYFSLLFRKGILNTKYF